MFSHIVVKYVGIKEMSVVNPDPKAWEIWEISVLKVVLESMYTSEIQLEYLQMTILQKELSLMLQSFLQVLWEWVKWVPKHQPPHRGGKTGALGYHELSISILHLYRVLKGGGVQGERVTGEP